MESVIKWKVVPLETPEIIKDCPRCRNKSFASSDRFRINSNKRISDIWLIYKCTECDYTWNMSIITRKNLEDYNKTEFDKFLANDKNLAWFYAFDKTILKKNKVRYKTNIKVLIEGDISALANSNTPIHKINFYSDYELDLPIKKILKQKFSLSNSEIERLHNNNYICVINHANSNLNTKLIKDLSLELNITAIMLSKNQLTVS